MEMENDKNECQVGILVDVPPSLQLIQEHYISINGEKCILIDDKDSLLEVQDCFKNMDLTCSENEISSKAQNSFQDSDTRKSVHQNSTYCEIETPKLHLKTPSPQSMSHISKEASKVLDNLNSSMLLDKNLALNEVKLPVSTNFDYGDISLLEEKLPIPINFDFEDVIYDENNLEDVNKAKIFSSASSESDIKKMYSPDDQKIVEYPYPKSDVYATSHDSYISSSNVKNASVNCAQFSSPHSDDVFFKMPIANAVRISSQKINSTIRPKMIKNLTLRKTLSANEVTSREANNSSFSTENKVNGPCAILNPPKKITKVKKSNSIAYQTCNVSKPSMKSALPLVSSKVPNICRSSSFEIKRKTDCVSKLREPFTCSQDANPTYVKKLRYEMHNKAKESSIPSLKENRLATPLKSTSLKVPTTPSVPSYSNLPKFRFTPQSAPRLSFSKSLQHGNNSFCSSSSKNVLKEKNSYSLRFGIPTTQPLSDKNERQGISSLNLPTPVKKIALSTSNKKRFCSKLSLPSPLADSQNRTLARALFPNLSEDY